VRKQIQTTQTDIFRHRSNNSLKARNHNFRNNKVVGEEKKVIKMDYFTGEVDRPVHKGHPN
jgi:hypothetical protein